MSSANVPCCAVSETVPPAGPIVAAADWPTPRGHIPTGIASRRVHRHTPTFPPPSGCTDVAGALTVTAPHGPAAEGPASPTASGDIANPPSTGGPPGGRGPGGATSTASGEANPGTH